LRPILLFLFLLSFSSWAAPAASQNGFVVYDFQDDWRIYDYDLKAYVPYMPDYHGPSPVHTWVGDLEKFRHYVLTIRVEDQPVYLFINGSLQRKLMPDEVLRWEVDSLLNVYPDQPWVLTLYGPSSLQKKHVQVVHEVIQATQKSFESASDTSLRPRSRMSGKTAISLMSVMGILLFSFLSSAFSKAFARFFNPLDWFTFLMREQSFLVNKPLNRVNLLFILLLCQIWVILYYLLDSKGIRLFSTAPLLDGSQDIHPTLFSYIRLLVLFYVGYMGKYFYLGIIGRLFNLDKIIDIHYFKAIQGALLFYSVLFLIFLPIFMGYYVLPIGWLTWFQWSIAGFYLIRGVMLYFTIIRTLPVQILHLISYLCLVELLPLLIGIRLAF